jgi:DNA-binding response OmpR family regulator
MKKTILIIEDNQDVRENTAEILELSNYNVLQAGNGKEGVEMAFKYKPHLVICDIMMPELDGYGVLHLLNKNKDTAHIPFIFLTAKSEKVDLRKGMEMGADDYLTKPFDGTELLNAIECRLAKQKANETYYSKALKSIEKLAQKNLTGAAELKNLISGRKIRQLKAKQTLYYEGDQSQGIYLLMSGVIKTFKLSIDGHELMTGWHQPEAFLGINELFAEESYKETAEAMEDSSVCFLPKEAIRDLFDRFPDISRKFVKLLSNSIIEKEEQLLELAYLSVRKRLSQVLVRLSNKLSGSTELTVSRSDLAAMAGMATETISRTLTDFKEEGLIERKGTQITILNINKLIKMKN